MKRFAAGAFALSLGACSGPPDFPPPTDEPRLNPAVFFTGRSEGKATLHVLFSDPVPVRVESVGRRDRQGRLVLDQRVREGDKAARMRRWVLGNAGPSQWQGSLTDASGPVRVKSSKNSGVIRYRMNNGMDVEQQLRLQPGGRMLLNRLTVTKFGVRVAWLDETIRKLD